jgi:hypothetical protein
MDRNGRNRPGIHKEWWGSVKLCLLCSPVTHPLSHFYNVTLDFTSGIIVVRLIASRMSSDRSCCRRDIVDFSIDISASKI